MSSLLYSYDKFKHKLEKKTSFYLFDFQEESINLEMFLPILINSVKKNCQKELLPSKCHSWGISGEVISAQHRFILFFSRSAFHQTIQLDRALRIKVQSFIGLAPAFCDRNLGTTQTTYPFYNNV